MSWGHGIAWAVLLGFISFMVWYDGRPTVVAQRDASSASYFVRHLEEDMRYLRDTATGDCFSYLPTSGTGGPAMAHIPCRDRINMVEFSSQ